MIYRMFSTVPAVAACGAPPMPSQDLVRLVHGELGSAHRSSAALAAEL
jgi:hypothetical protein